MTLYVDSFLVPVPRANVDAYLDLARLAGAVWIDHGALQYVETLADDVPHGEKTDFYRAVQAQEDETVVVAWAVYRSRAHRDEVVAKVMADPRMQHDPARAPFDSRRMVWGGFAPAIVLGAGYDG